MRNDSKLIEIEPGRFVIDRPRQASARSPLPCPYIISDEMPPIEQVDGRFYTSKRKFRAVGRSLGLIEVGNEKPKPRVRNLDTPPVRQQRRDAIKKAVEKFKSGHRAKGST